MAGKKKKAKRNKKAKKVTFFKDNNLENNEASINPTKKFIVDKDDSQDIELTETGMEHFKTLKVQKHIDAMEPPVLLDDLFHNLESITLNPDSFLELEENESLSEGIKHHVKDGDNLWLFSETNAMMLDYALMCELSFDITQENILNYAPVILQEKVYFVSSKEMVIYDLKEEKWSSQPVSGEITSSIIIKNDHLYVVVDYNRLLCFDASMKECWSFITESYLLNTPVLDDENIYISSSDGMLYKLDLDGDIVWTFNSKAALETPPIIYQDIIIISSMSGKLSFISKNDKEESFIVDIGFPLFKKMVIKNEKLYVSNRRFIYKVDLVEYKISEIIKLNQPIEYISDLEHFIHIKTSDSFSIIANEDFTNLNKTNFKSFKTPLQHVNFLLSINESHQLLKTEII